MRTIINSIITHFVILVAVRNEHWHSTILWFLWQSGINISIHPFSRITLSRIIWGFYRSGIYIVINSNFIKCILYIVLVFRWPGKNFSISEFYLLPTESFLVARTIYNTMLFSIFTILYNSTIILRKKCPYSELFWFAFSRIWTEFARILRISPYSVRMRENADQNNSKYGYFSRCVTLNHLKN